jgi:hypothetical protein
MEWHLVSWAWVKPFGHVNLLVLGPSIKSPDHDLDANYTTMMRCMLMITISIAILNSNTIYRHELEIRSLRFVVGRSFCFRKGLLQGNL